MEHTFVAVGALIGLSVAAPVGPMGVLCINRTLACGAAAGVCTGAGAATVQVLYCTVALLGLRQAGPWLEAHGPVISLCGAALMLWFAWRILQPRQVGLAQQGRASLLAAYGSAVALNAANPMLLVLLVGAIAALLGPDPPHGPETGAVLLGVFAGSLLWWVCLSNAVALLRGRMGAPLLRRVNQVAALVLAGFSALAVLRAVRG